MPDLSAVAMGFTGFRMTKNTCATTPGLQSKALIFRDEVFDIAQRSEPKVRKKIVYHTIHLTDCAKLP